MGNPKSLAITSMVLGICACALAWVPFLNILALAAGIVGLVLSMKAKKLAATQNLTTWDGKGMNTAGLVLSIIGIVLAVINVILWIIAMMAFSAVAHAYGVSTTW